MVFTRYLAGKIWSSICIQDIVLHQINPIRLISFFFLYQICLTGNSDENDYLHVQNTEANK